MSLRRRLFGATALAVVFSVAISLVIGGVLTRSALRQTILANLSRQADVIYARVVNGGTVPRRRGSPQVAFLATGRAERLLPASAAAAVASGHQTTGSARLNGRNVFFAARPLGGRTLIVYRSSAVQAEDWGPFLDSFLIAGLAGAGLAALVSLVLARAISKPVMRVARASRAVAAGDAPEPIPVEGPAELATLATSFNQMRAELDAVREAERGFLLSVSHELKTPLTAIRGYVEAMSDGAVSPEESGCVIEREATRLERLVRDLLDLGRLDQKTFTVQPAAIDLASAARHVVRRYEPLAREFGVSLATAPAAGAFAWADEDRVVQVLSNLVENALRVTPVAGTVTVAVEPSLVTVEDTGPGLEPEDVPHAFERFYLYRRRANDRAVGSGLGLAIVKELAEAMGGSVSVTSIPGAGTRFAIRLPPCAVPDHADA